MRVPILQAALVASALLVPATGRADPPDTADACASPRSTLAVNLCARQQSDAEDQRLNEAYRKLLAQLDNDSQRPIREKLIKAQRLWIQFRDADCAAQESVYQGGSVHTSVYLECLRDHTRQRIEDLDPLKWQGG